VLALVLAVLASVLAVLASVRGAVPVVVAGLLATIGPVALLRSWLAPGARAGAALLLVLVSIAGFVAAPAGNLFLPSAVAMSASALQVRRTNVPVGRAAWRATIAAIALALAAAAALLFVPFGTICTAEARPVGEPQAEPVCEPGPTLMATEGPGVIGLLAIPAIHAAVPVAAGRRRPAQPLRAVSALLLTAFSIVGIFSVGLFFVPAALAMVMAASLDVP